MATARDRSWSFGPLRVLSAVMGATGTSEVRVCLCLSASMCVSVELGCPPSLDVRSAVVCAASLGFVMCSLGREGTEWDFLC